jgi:hypothetical protein
MANPIAPRRALRAVLVKDLTAFVERAFRDLDPRTVLRLAPELSPNLGDGLRDQAAGTCQRL